MRVAMIVLGLGALGAELAGLPVPLRAPVVLAFLVTGPGYLIVRRLDLTGASRWVLVVATSLAITAVCGEGLAIAGRWDATTLLGLLVAVCVIAAVPPGVPKGRHR